MKPKWNETFQIQIDSINDNVQITCYDEDALVNDVIGEVMVKISDLLGND